MRSLCNKFQDFSHFIRNESFTFIALTETWLQPDLPDSSLFITGYNILRKDRASRGGGVALYIQGHITCSMLQLPLEGSSSVEFLLVKAIINKIPVGIAVVYRPNNLDYCDLGIISDVIVCFQSNNIEKLLILGDFNVNLLDDSISSRFMRELVFQHDCSQLVKDPTRVTCHSQSLLDVVITNFSENDVSAEVSEICFSDHNAIIGYINIKYAKPPVVTKAVRSFRDFCRDDFEHDASLVDWNQMYCMESLDGKVDFFNSTIINLFNIHAPIKEVSLGSGGSNNAWFTDTLFNMRKLVRKAWLRYKHSRNDAHRQYFCDLRNYYNSAVRQEKRAYFTSQISTFSRNNRVLWRKLRCWNISRSSDNSGFLPEHLHDADAIQDYFMSSVPDNSPDSDYVNNFYSLPKSDSSFVFRLSDVDEIKSIVLDLKPDICGPDCVSGRMLQLSSNFVVAPLTHVINVSLERGIVPSQWKTCLTFPVPKGSSNRSDKLELKDLRPISILPVCLKVVEKFLYTQLFEHINRSGILPVTQSGFRRAFGTHSVLSKITDDAIKASDSGYLTSLTLLDLTKAFDCVNFDCLISKLYSYGIHNSSLSWISSYLHGRTQFTLVRTPDGCNRSESSLVRSGVPQGSTLGPLLFLIYLADLPAVIKHCQAYFYADDIQLYLSFNPDNHGEAAQRINADLVNIVHWLKINALSINPAKCQNILLGCRHVLKKIPSLDIFVSDIKVPYYSSVRNLGVVMDRELTFSEHVSSLCKRSYYALKQLFPYSNLLDRNTKLYLADSLVLSVLNYCDVVYGPCISQSDRQRLQRIQNYCIRFVRYVPAFASITPFIRELHCLKMQERRLIHYVTFVLKIMKTGLPEYLYETVHSRNTVHDRNLRNIESLFCIPAHRTSFFKSSFSYLSVYILNNLPVELKALSPHSIRIRLKKLLLSESYCYVDVKFF